MITTRLTTDAVERADRFTWWHDMTVTTLIPTVLNSAHTDDFRATADVVDLGTAQITSMTYLPMTSTRTPKLIRRHDPEYYQLSLTVRGRMHLSQAGRDTTLGPGDLVIYDSSRAFDGWTACDHGSLGHVVAQIPKRLVPVRPKLMDRLIAHRIPADGGFSDLLAQYLTHVTTRTHHYRTSDAAHLSTVLVDLLAATVAHQQLENPGALTPESRRHSLFLHIQGFIHRHLGDPRLTPERIAAAHHISARSLHRLFQGQGLTVSAFIRRQRLERARRDLADPRLGDRPIHAIAARCGFPRPADFTRAFRTEYGLPPRDYRSAVCARPARRGPHPPGHPGHPGPE
ncbi:helix-turn-helix domain-containing protein [Streptomyces sp. NA02950]|uniref:AraC-like ligand-binding domain-containing protein n=1 Tax=Streptomyces sp. NA02950 TaxID=2742137 RepID=UPI00158FA937|nr:helix-turn-helix domain-containing protein [Streptomyces sp. NA02950]QKV91514.1 helix-turn-helix domain-containing protein [Streptomyces sp. NA02950]